MNPLATAVFERLDAPGKSARVLITAAGVVDAAGVRAAPGGVLIEAAWDAGDRVGLRLLAAGSPASVQSACPPGEVIRLDAGSFILIPALVNAHTHLDLTHLGPRPYEASGGFVGWVDMVRTGRCTEPAALTASVARGVALSRCGAVGAVGDIAGCPPTGPTAQPAIDASHAGMSGTSFLEFFGMGAHRDRGLDRARAAIDGANLPPSGMQLGLGPHATNTVARPVLRRALACTGRPVSIHVAETPEEKQFIASGTGPQRELLERVGVWDDSILEDIGRGLSPVEHIAQALAGGEAASRTAPIALVHVNDCSDRDLELLARLRRGGVDVHVVYCPRASAYFGTHEVFGPHRYRRMLDLGIPVALGTDSIIHADPRHAERLTPWDDMRLLHARDGMSGDQLLAMATVAGARAIGISPEPFTFANPGPLAGVAIVRIDGATDKNDLISTALEQGHSPEFLLYNNQSCLTAT
ncbi:MAG: 5'-deoxyadenosine deaminase [Phycisphaerales bacterium]|nr:5'-deoxyadenosine deaminase [Phycisphaerales bacterium]